MDNFTPLKTKNKNKKANKFLIIGNLLLVIIVAGIGFFYYNNTLLTTQQKASFDCDASIPGDCKKKGKEYVESGQQEANQEAKKKKERDEKKMKEEIFVPAGGCPGGYTSCDINGNRFCISNDGSEGGCSNGAVDRGITVKTGIGVGSGVAEQGGWICEIGKKGYSGGPCLAGNSVKTIGNQKPPGCFCGIIQIDGGQWDGTYQSTCGCGSKEEETQVTTTLIGTIIPTPTGEETPTSTPTPTIIPTATPIISNTPTVTPLISNTPTVTPLISNTPTVTPLISNTPGPSATPTEIILAKISTSPTVVKLLQTGVVKSFMFLIPATIMLIGLIL